MKGYKNYDQRRSQRFLEPAMRFTESGYIILNRPLIVEIGLSFGFVVNYMYSEEFSSVAIKINYTKTLGSKSFIRPTVCARSFIKKNDLVKLLKISHDKFYRAKLLSNDKKVCIWAVYFKEEKK